MHLFQPLENLLHLSLVTVEGDFGKIEKLI